MWTRHHSSRQHLAKSITSAFAVIGLASSNCLASIGAAHAGPDDSISFVATEGHVDGPKAYWNETTGNFELRVEQGRRAELLENTVNWIGKGSGKINQYTFQVDGGDMANVVGQEFLGAPKDLLYWSPQVTWQNAPIWAGYGADAGIPADKFRDGTFSLDIVGWDGPGRYEAFSRPVLDEEGLYRMWSSHSPGLRSTWIRPGSHTHNHSTFSKPGRYEATYQVTARDTEGSRIASPPQTLVWQIGGTRPNPAGLGDIAAAYNASNDQGLPEQPTFTMRPHTHTGTMPGEEFLTDLVFSTGDTSNDGTAVFYIDGYFLAEVPLSGGTALWPEMIGQGASNFQVVYIPKSSGTRWVSTELNYIHGQESSTVSDLGEFPEPHSNDPAPVFDNSDFNVTDDSVTITYESTDNDELRRFTITPADERLSFRVEDAQCFGEFTSAPELRSRLVSADDCDDEPVIRLVPTSRADVGAVDVKISLDKTTIARFSQQNASNNSPVSSHDSGNSDSTEADDSQTKPDNPGTKPSENPVPPRVVPPKDPQDEPQASALDASRIPSDHVELEKGHIDLGPVFYSDGSIRFMLGDDSRKYAREKIYRRPEDVTMKVGKTFLHTLSKRNLERTGDFLGRPGDEIYVIGSTQKKDWLWPGFSTEFGGGVPYDIEIEPLNTPDGGKWWAYTQNMGTIMEKLGSYEGPTRIQRSETVHLHNEWVFTTPGTYTMKMRAVQNNNADNVTDWSTVTFVVGDDDAASAGEVNDKPGATDTADTGSTPPQSKPPHEEPPRVVPPKKNPTTPQQPGKDETQIPSTKLEISQGHIDLGPVSYDDGSVRFMLGDESFQHDKHNKVYRKPDDVILVAGDEFKMTVDQKSIDAVGDFIGSIGDEIYLLDQTQHGNNLWPGFSSQHAGGPAFDFEIAPESAPVGATWWAYTSGSFGGVGEMFGSSQGPSTISRSEAVHVHNNWIFTKPGTYTMKMRAVQHGNPANATEWSTVTFKVGGGSGNTTHVTPGGTPADKPAPRPAPAPGTSGGNAGSAPNAQPTGSHSRGGANGAASTGNAGSAAPAGASNTKPAGAQSGGAQTSGAKPAGGSAAGAPAASNAAKSTAAKSNAAKSTAAKSKDAKTKDARTKDAKNRSGSAQPANAASSSTYAAEEPTHITSVWEILARITAVTMTLIGCGFGGIAAWRRFF